MCVAIVITTVGVALVLFGIKGFKPEGIQLTGGVELKGRTGRLVGLICLILGSPIALFGFWMILQIANRPR